MQLALAIDYAIILCHRFSDEHETLPTREACIAALSKAIPEISSSSLTTISGLAALAFMHFGIGRDLPTVLIKAILFSMLCVFTLMPGLLVLFSKLIDKTRHKEPDSQDHRRRQVRHQDPLYHPADLRRHHRGGGGFCQPLPLLLHLHRPGHSKAERAPDRLPEDQNEFGSSNMVAVIVPSGDYESEGRILDELDSLRRGQIHDGPCQHRGDGRLYMLTDALTRASWPSWLTWTMRSPRRCTAPTLSIMTSTARSSTVWTITKFRFMICLCFWSRRWHDGNITLGGDVQDTLDDLFDQLDEAQKQLQSDSYSRLVVYLNLPEETDETFAFVNKMHDIIGKYYDKDSFYVVGNTTSAMDLSSSFSVRITCSSVCCLRCSLFWSCCSPSSLPVCRCCSSSSFREVSGSTFGAVSAAHPRCTSSAI